MLHDPSPEVLLDALEVMWMIEPDPEISIPLLLPLLTNTSGRVRTEASYVLGELTPLPEIAIDALTLALSDENWVVRANSARAVGRSGITSPHIAGELDKLLTDNREVAKCRAIEALARLYGPAAPECSSNFLPAMADANAMPSNPYCTLMLLNATSSLGSNPPPNAIREADLHVLLTESAAYCCSEALATLPLLRKASIETVPALVLNAYLRFLQSHENGYIRQHASLAYSNAATQQPITPSPSH
jgi:HEAT repeat protein